jgi:hypothetical protein
MELTEKEKALEIYHNHARRWHSTSEDIKYSALITVDEMIKEVSLFDRTDGYVQKRIDYLEQVKQKIIQQWT